LGSAAITITGTPVNCSITATILDLSGFPDTGNYFILDDFSFDVPIGIPSVASSSYFIDPPVPNPATTATTLSYTIPEPVDLDLKMYDLFGRQVKLIHIDNAVSGENQLILDSGGLNDGVYVLVLESELGMVQRRIVFEH
jgi:hypothetical protein